MHSITIPGVSEFTQNCIAAGIGFCVAVILLLVRWRIHLAMKSQIPENKREWRYRIIRITAPLTIVWSLWLGILAGMLFAAFPDTWLFYVHHSIPAIFVSLVAYTLIILVIVGLDYFDTTVARFTKNKVDDIVVAFLKLFLPAVIIFLAVVLILAISGVDVTAITKWLAEHGVTISAILITGIILLLVSSSAISHFIRNYLVKLRAEETEEELKKRTETLVSVITTTTQVVVVVGMVLMVLSELNINITTILAGVGVVGIAVGFGAQSLVKDLIAGLFIIFENQYRKGDVVKVADVSGLVEDINLRRTILRDLDGIVHVIPNGEIRVSSNFTKVWSRVNLNVSVAYKTDLDKAIEVINRVGRELAGDPKWASAVITPPQFLRVDKFGDSGIELKILGETKPIRQWEVMGELRLRLKRAFDKEGIEIPWPHTKVYFGEELKINQR